MQNGSEYDDINWVGVLNAYLKLSTESRIKFLNSVKDTKILPSKS